MNKNSLLTIGICLTLSASQSGALGQTMSGSAYNSDILKALDARGNVRTISYYDYFANNGQDEDDDHATDDIPSIGFYADGTPFEKISENDGSYTISGTEFASECIRDSFGVSFTVKNDSIKDFSFYAIGVPICNDFEILDYNSMGRPHIAWFCGDQLVTFSYSDFDSHGNWTKMNVEETDASDNEYYRPPKTIRRIIEYWPDNATYNDVPMIPSDEDLCALIKRANLVKKGTLTNELDSISRQCIDADNIDMGPGSGYSHASPFMMLYTGEDVPEDLNFQIDTKKCNGNRTRMKVLFKWTEKWPGYNSGDSEKYAMALLNHAGGSWKVDDLGLFDGYGWPGEIHGPDTWVKGSMKAFLDRFNRDVMDGTAEIDVRASAEEWGVSRDQLEKEIEHIEDYKYKYLVKRVKIEIPENMYKSGFGALDARKALGIHVEKPFEPTSNKSNTSGNGKTEHIVVKEPIDSNAVQSRPQVYEGEIFVATEETAAFPGGQAALMKWIGNNMIVPDCVKNGSVTGRVIVKFVIEKDGNTSNAQIVRSLHPDADREAIRIVEKMPKLFPAKNNSQPVRSYFTLPITFQANSTNPNQK